MTPMSFDAETAREVTGDAAARTLEAKARLDADAGTFLPPIGASETYWGQVQDELRVVVYREQYTKRLKRNERKKTPNVGDEAQIPAARPRQKRANAARRCLSPRLTG